MRSPGPRLVNEKAAMHLEPQTSSRNAPYNLMYFMALLQTHKVARQAIRRLEDLCARYPDPALEAAVEALRREEEDCRWRVDVPHVPLC